MLKSMTGYGAATIETNTTAIDVEVRTLNSKFLDASLRIPKQLNPVENELRSKLQKTLVRGKISLSVDVRNKQVKAPISYNEELFKYYYSSLSSLAKSVGDEGSNLFVLALQSPEVITGHTNGEIDYMNEIQEAVSTALAQCDEFRCIEGAALQAKLLENVGQIETIRKEIEASCAQRTEKVRTRLQSHIDELSQSENLDTGRLEQEMLFYMEKLDINEELVRLAQHVKYFHDVTNQEEGQGRKLGFISQEMGREINTIGSKANDADIQKLVVAMKDELEKIKEQVLNVL